MGTFVELKETVKQKGYGSAQFTNINGHAIYLSRGIREVFLKDETEEQKIIEVVERFLKKDYGDAEMHGKNPRPGHEYGRYAIAEFEDAEEDTAVWVHHTEEAIIVYFKFER